MAARPPLHVVVSPSVHVTPVIHLAPHISTGSSVLPTAVVAVGSAVAGSLAGAYGSFKGSMLLEKRRREARAAIRRKAKLYTPLRQELQEAGERLEQERQFGPFGIARESPGTISPPPVLGTWRQMVDDGRAMSASKRVAAAMDQLDQRVDRFNVAYQETARVFNDQGAAILSNLGAAPSIANWTMHDVGPLLRHDFRALNILGTGVPQVQQNDGMRKQFEQAWLADPAVRTAERTLTRANSAMLTALTEALGVLEKDMQQIATKYERDLQDS